MSFEPRIGCAITMTTSLRTFLASSLLTGLAGILVSAQHAIQFLLVLLAAYFFAYVKKKAEGLATKQDVSEITRLVEEVRSRYEKDLELWRQRLDLTKQLQLAALEQRLQKHQKAVEICFRLPEYVYAEEQKRLRFLNYCRRWFLRNCLYLTPNARDAFLGAFVAAGQHALLLDGWRSGKEQDSAIKANWSRITEAPFVIMGEVGLPPPTAELAEALRPREPTLQKEGSVEE